MGKGFSIGYLQPGPRHLGVSPSEAGLVVSHYPSGGSIWTHSCHSIHTSSPFPQKKPVKAVTWAPWSEMQVATSLYPKRPGRAGYTSKPQRPARIRLLSCKAFPRQDPFWLCNISALTLPAGARGRGHWTGPERPTSFTQVENNPTEMWSKVSLPSTGSRLKLLNTPPPNP